MANTLNNIGSVYVCISNYNLALENYHKALELRKNVMGLESLTVYESIINIGYCYFLSRNTEKAIKFYQEALKILEKLKPDHYLENCKKIKNQIKLINSK